MNTSQIGAELRRAADLRASGRILEAISVYESVLRAAPHLADSWYNLGLLRRRAGRPEAALEAYDQALARGVTAPEEIRLNKAVVLSEDLRRPEAARAELGTALRLRPDYLPALLNLGNLHEERGDADAAIAAYERVLSLSAHHAIALSRLADFGPRWARNDNAIALLQIALDQSQPPADRALLTFSLARRLDAAREFDQAFAAATSAHQLNRQAAGNAVAAYDPEAMEHRVATLCEAFAQPEPRREQAGQPMPIFIVGMFRSGSTLLEQILAGHELIDTGGELPLIPRTVALVRPYPTAIVQATRDQLDRLAAAYRAEIRKAFPEARYVTDKRPDNFEHVGLIKRMFPGARILYTRRNPLDICVSTHFLHIDPAISWAATPETTAHQIVQCTRLMDHWMTLYPDDMLTVDYEDLTRDPEPQIRQVLAFLDLPWSDSCMNFHDNRTQVKTASVWQVRERLHTRSIGRWQSYSQQLARASKLLSEAGLIGENMSIPAN